MKTATLVFAFIMGPLTFGLLLAGLIQLMVTEDGNRPPQVHAGFGDVLVMLLNAIGVWGGISALLIAARNWPERPVARRFIHAGTISGLVTVVLLLLAE